MRYRELVEVENSAPIMLWHGGRIEGAAEVQSPRKGRYEGGPGIYLTNHYKTAFKYAKGGGSTFLVTLKPDLRFAFDVFVPLEDGIDFVKSNIGASKRKDIIADLKANCARHNAEAFRAEVLINLIVNYEAGSGRAGLALARFLTDHGVDASYTNQSNDEQWIVVYNPAAILKAKKVPAAEVTLDMRELPRIAEK